MNTGMFDKNGKEFMRGQIVSISKYFDDNIDYGYVEKDFDNWVIIGKCKEWNRQIPFELDLKKEGHKFEIVDNVVLPFTFEEIRTILYIE